MAAQTAERIIGKRMETMPVPMLRVISAAVARFLRCCTLRVERAGVSSLDMFHMVKDTQ